MNKNQVGALIIVLLMVLSVVGFSGFYNTSQKEPQKGPDQEIPDLPTQPLPVRFVADATPATVYQLLPSVRIAATAKIFTISELDSAIRQFGGIRNIHSEFRAGGSLQADTNMVYVADISFESDVNRLELVSYIKNRDEFSAVDSLSFALVEVPKTIELVSENKDLGLTKQYSFPNTIIEAFVTNDRVAGDPVNLKISIEFVGNSAKQVIAFESAPPLPKIEQKQAVVTASIASLKPELIVTATVDSSQLADKNAFTRQFTALEGIETAQLAILSDFNSEVALSQPISLKLKLMLAPKSETVALENTRSMLSSITRDFSITRSATLALTTVDDLNVSDMNIVVQVLPERTVGETREFSLSYLRMGEKILSISGQEIPDLG